jgi:hypothetical protein
MRDIAGDILMNIHMEPSAISTFRQMITHRLYLKDLKLLI